MVLYDHIYFRHAVFRYKDYLFYDSGGTCIVHTHNDSKQAKKKKKKKGTLLIMFGSFMTLFIVMFAPINNGALNRFRSAFNSKDESLNVRDMNRHYIQPYIYQASVWWRYFYNRGRRQTLLSRSSIGRVSTRQRVSESIGTLEQGWMGFFLLVVCL